MKTDKVFVGDIYQIEKNEKKLNQARVLLYKINDTTYYAPMLKKVIDASSKELENVIPFQVIQDKEHLSKFQIKRLYKQYRNDLINIQNLYIADLATALQFTKEEDYQEKRYVGDFILGHTEYGMLVPNYSVINPDILVEKYHDSYFYYHTFYKPYPTEDKQEYVRNLRPFQNIVKTDDVYLSRLEATLLYKRQMN